MSSLESNGFPSPSPDSGEGHLPEPPAPLVPLQPFDEVPPLSVEPAQEPFQPLQPLQTAAVESFPVQQAEPAVLPPLEPVSTLEPLQPLQPTMPPPLPLLTTAVEETPAQPAPLAPTPDEVANLGVPLGTLIFRAGLLTEEQLEDALQEGVRSGKRLGEVLVESGLLDERDLGRLLADQKGLRFVELSTLALDPAATALLSAEKAHMFAALPVGIEAGVPLVAVADPSNELVTENLRRALGSEPRLVVASRSDLHATIDRVHGAAAEAPAPAPVAEAEPVVVPEPVALPEPEPVFEAVALQVPEPVAQPVENGYEPVPAVAPEPAAEPVLQPVQVEPVAPSRPETAGYETVAPLVATPEPEPTVEPAEPEPVAAVAVPVAEPAPEAEAVEPVSPEPVELAPLVTPVGPPAHVEAPAPETTFSRVEAEEPRTHEPQPELPSALSYEVSLRLADGERVPVGSFGEPQKAREYARDVVKHLSQDADGWPFFGGRFLRPETIVSVDIVPVGEPDRWLGSSVRSNWASRLNR
jgi:hypothetical protein